MWDKNYAFGSKKADQTYIFISMGMILLPLILLCAMVAK